MTKMAICCDPALTARTTGRRLNWWEWKQLERQGCTATDWNRVHVTDDTDLALICRVHFEGDVSVGTLTSSADSRTGIYDATLADCAIGDEVLISGVRDSLRGAFVGDRARIVDCGRIVFEPEAPCGVGTTVNVLDETGSRPVTIYPGMSAQIAVMAARMPVWAESHLAPGLADMLDAQPVRPLIGEEAQVLGCGLLLNCAVGREVHVEGASRLVNGSVVNNAAHGRPLARIGSGVDAENFIVEDGCVLSGAILRNVYVGQGATLEKGFTAHDSLFFANCSMENGEACAVLAAPYTVSMHKSTLLIGAQMSFMNAGSGTNQSNHMYKLGPVHWGIMERGVKTSSGSYVMWGAKIGAFSLVMGQHKTHPDSSEFPFSYLFGDDKGGTTVVPGMMLRSCGLLRDEKKWPTRDRRLKRRLPLHDRIAFDVLNPVTVGTMLDALTLIKDLLGRPCDDDRFVRYKGMKFRCSNLERATKMYSLAIYKYLSIKLPGGVWPEPAEEDAAPQEWLDLGGQFVTRETLEQAKEAETPADMEALFTKAAENYAGDEALWIAARFDETWRRPKYEIDQAAAEFDRLIDEDRATYREKLAAENSMLAL